MSRKKWSKRRISSILKKLFIGVVISGYFIGGLGVVESIVSVWGNTKALENDKSIIKVVNITILDELELGNGKTVSTDDIKVYTKVLKGSGSWYIEDLDCFISEVTILDIVRVYGYPLCYLVMLFIVLVRYVSRERLVGSWKGRVFLGVCFLWFIGVYVVGLGVLLGV